MGEEGKNDKKMTDSGASAEEIELGLLLNAL